MTIIAPHKRITYKNIGFFLCTITLAMQATVASAATVHSCCVCTPIAGGAPFCGESKPRESGDAERRQLAEDKCTSIRREFAGRYTCQFITAIDSCTSSPVCAADGARVGQLDEPDPPTRAPARAETTLPSTPTPPKLQIPIPGLPYPELSKVELQGEQGQRFLLIPWIGQYIAGIYRYAITLVGIIATVMIIYGGMRWLTAAGDASAIGKAKEIITNAVIGLVLLLATTVILYTVNPELTQFKNLRIAFTERLKMPEVVENEGDDQARSLSGVNCPDPSQLAVIPASRGLINTAGKKARPDVVAALIRAGEAATAQGCEISITESWRSLAQQQQYWEGSLRNRRRECPSCSEEEIVRRTRQATSYPDPSCSNNAHIMGHAVDVKLVCDIGGRKTDIAGFGGCKGQNAIPVANRKKLQTIMAQGGFVRYCAENWHFEVGTNRWNEGKASNREYAGNCECAGVYHDPY